MYWFFINWEEEEEEKNVLNIYMNDLFNSSFSSFFGELICFIKIILIYNIFSNDATQIK